MAEHTHVVLSKRLVAINSASSVLARVVNFTVLLWVYQYLLRHLPADEFAILPLVTALMVFGPLFFSFFIGGIVRYMIDAYAKGDFEEMRRVASSLFPVLLAFSAFILPLGLYFAVNIEKVFNVAPQVVDDAKIMIALLMVSFVFRMISVPFTTAYAISQRYFEKSLLDVAGDLIRAGLTVGFLLGFGPAVIYVVVATVIAESLMNAIMLYRSFRIVPELWYERRLFSFALARELTGFGLWTTLDRLGGVMHTHAATLILNIFGTAVDVTAYYVGATFFRQIESTIKLAALPLQPAVTAMNALNDKARLAATVLRGGRYGLWVSMLVAVPMTIYADVFVQLYLGSNYEAASWVIILFMVIFLFTQPTILLATTAMATKSVREFFLPAFLFQCFGLALMFVFAAIFELGAIGVTLGLTISTALSQLLYFWHFCLKLTGRRFSEFFQTTLVRGLIPACVAGVAWVLLKFGMPPDTWAALLMQGFVGACVYVLALLAFCLDAGEKHDLQALKAKILS
ncbi:MAG: hypothetical protein ACFB11_05980 [Paracoccaceae bacterium]|mgnify:CR=1 FL=1